MYHDCAGGSRKCQVESGDCDRQPVYGWPGERATRCGTHKLERTVRNAVAVVILGVVALVCSCGGDIYGAIALISYPSRTVSVPKELKL